MWIRDSALQRLLDRSQCLELVDVGTSDDQTPLHIAAVNGYREVAQVLVEKVINYGRSQIKLFAIYFLEIIRASNL